MSDHDDRYLDYDFTKDERYVFGDLGRNPKFGDVLGADDVVPILSESQQIAAAERIDAEGLGLENLVTRIYDQGQEGSCVANMASQMMEVGQAARHGKANVVPLSAISLYKRIGRSPSSGAMVDDALDEGASRGILPLDTPENRKRFSHVMPHTGFHTPFPSGWESTAKLFRYGERFVIRNAQEMRSVLLAGYPVGVGRAGHSILYLRPVHKSGRWQYIYVNSWQESWGEAMGRFSGGFGRDSESLARESAQWAYAVRSFFVPPVVQLV